MNWEQILFKSGDLFLPIPIKTFLETYMIGDDTTLFYVNYWSIVHLISGIILGYLLLKNQMNSTYFLTGLFIHTLWEIWQMVGKNTLYWTKRGQIDIATDTFFFLVGMYILFAMKGG